MLLEIVFGTVYALSMYSVTCAWSMVFLASPIVSSQALTAVDRSESLVHKQEISSLILLVVSRFSSIVLNCHVNKSLLLIRPLPLIDSDN